jgi:hypothetical protein
MNMEELSKPGGNSSKEWLQGLIEELPFPLGRVVFTVSLQQNFIIAMDK